MSCTVEEASEDEDDAKPTDPDHPQEGDRIFMTVLNPLQTICATSTVSQRLAEASEKERLKKSFEELVPDCYHHFKKVFLKESFDELPTSKKWDHAIELVPGAEPSNSKLYPLSLNEQKELDQFLDENLKSGRIRPSKSPMASPVFFVKKKDGALRFVQDYRKLNAMTVKNAYPLPLVPDMMNQISGAKYFTK